MTRRRTSRCDAGFSDTLGVVLMIVMSLSMAAGLYVWVFGLSPDAESGPSLALDPEGDVSDTGVKRILVTSASEGIGWGDLLIQVDGRPYDYDHSLTGGRKWCVATSGSDCIPADHYRAAFTPVAAEQTLYLQDLDLAGRTLEVVHVASGKTLARAHLGGLSGIS